MRKDYYIINNKNLAITISTLLNEDFYTFDDNREGREGKKCYSFKNTDRFREILSLVNNTRNI
ncbi:hypothetical protein [Clostridium beijerinckii]|uniref:DUF5659 domain-containing protein n=1 Tax=Clostridium beijerinckii TaxID=1520 RepID=A0AAE5H0F5_CLOBE|nr:hypothetical protein [Clostridium beijerinckii]NSB12101.1 hypothetical protein [Clostridium beijerinckii]OOM27435.1 hypothetical protein CLOBE_29930 [Clostridium beijerinckii]